MFNFCSIEHVCAPVGRLLGLDAPTRKKTRPSVARAEIEVDMSKNGIDKVRLEIWNEKGEAVGFWQRIEYETLSAWCCVCGLIGHSSATCRRIAAAVEVVEQGVETVAKPAEDGAAEEGEEAEEEEAEGRKAEEGSGSRFTGPLV